MSSSVKKTKPKQPRRSAGTSSRPPSAYLERDDLVEAAAELADREGWMHLTLSDAARAVDRHVTSLYGHVDGLAGLRRQVVLLGLRELGDDLWGAALGRTGPEGLGVVMDVYRSYLSEHPGRSEAILHADRGDVDVQTLGTRLVEPIYATLRSFGLPEDAVATAQQLLSAAIRGFGAAEASGAYGSRAEADAAFAQLERLFLDALSSGRWPERRS